MPGPEGWYLSLVTGPRDLPAVRKGGSPASGGVRAVFGVRCAAHGDASVATVRRKDEPGLGQATSVEPEGPIRERT